MHGSGCGLLQIQRPIAQTKARRGFPPGRNSRVSI
jgi:hypothetical protein